MAGGKIPIPKPWHKRLLRSTHFYDVLIAIAAFLFAGFAATRLYTEGWGWTPFIIAFIGFIATVMKAVIGFQKDGGTTAIHVMEGCLHGMKSLLLADLSDEEKAACRLRLTVHVPTEDKEHLIQVLDYVGDQRGGRTVNRKTPSNCGVIGLALSTKQMAVGARDDFNLETYRSELVKKWHYSDAAARKLDGSTMSWLAIPLVSVNNEVAGVIYVDSAIRDFFSENRVQLAMKIASGVAEFVQTRF